MQLLNLKLKSSYQQPSYRDLESSLLNLPRSLTTRSFAQNLLNILFCLLVIQILPKLHFQLIDWKKVENVRYIYTDRQKKPDTYFGGGGGSVKQVHNRNLVYTTFKTNHFSTISCKHLIFSIKRLSVIK